MAIDTEERKSGGQPAAKQGGDQIASAANGKNNNKKIIIIVVAIVGALIVLSIVGTIISGFLAKKALESGIGAMTGGNVQIDTDDDSSTLSIKGDDGESIDMKSGKELPSGLPASVPLYEDADLESSSETTISGEQTSYIMSFDSDDNQKEIFDYYKKALSSNGWETTIVQQRDGFYMINAANESENVSMSYSYTGSSSEDEDSYQIMVNVSHNKE